ncbi:PAP-associated domain-containing protein 5, partial [Stegodyphus mimosarum]
MKSFRLCNIYSFSTAVSYLCLFLFKFSDFDYITQFLIKMEESPRYTSDSYIPFPSDRNVKKNNSKNYHRERGNENCSQTNQKTSSENFTAVPWKKSAQYSCGVVGLHEEICDFFETMRPTEQETEIRLKVVEHITKIVHSLWPQAKVEIFGSFRTGLYLPS